MIPWGLLLLLVLCLGCEKNSFPGTEVVLQLRNQAFEDLVSFENVNGTWDANGKHAEIDAAGYRYELFRLKLKNLADTGFITKLSTDEIYYLDGLEFSPSAIESGAVHITQLTPKKIEADFLVHFISRSGNYCTISGRFIVLNQ